MVSVTSTTGGLSLLRTCSILAIAASTTIAAPAWAQQAQGPIDLPHSASTTPDQAEPQTTEPATSEDIVVTGTRASLAKSLEAKRRADSIVDVVTAEDIGKFPDQNVAEALQRIPGVAIDRSGGEGRFASVNGLGPSFVSVLVNGRQMANDNPDRSFSFDTFASELVRTTKVYKSANAIIPEGGIGGTIDIITAKPFDFKGFLFSGKVGGLYEENSKKASPQASFMITNRFLDGRLGVLGSFNYFERKARTYRTQTSAIIPNVFFDFNSYAYVGEDGEDAFRMQDLERSIDDEKRTRLGGTVAIQFEASDNLEFTADYLYSKLDVDSINNSALNYFWAAQDTPNNVRDEDGVYTVFDHGVNRRFSGYAYTRAERYRPVDTHALGLNAKWRLNDRLKGNIDLSGSTAVTDNRGLDRDYTVEALDQGGFLVITEGGVPYLQGPNLFVPEDNNVGLLRARLTSDSGTYSKSRNWQLRGDATYDFGQQVFLNFGASHGSQRKENEFWQTPNAIRRLYHGNATRQEIDTDSIITGILRPGNVFGNANLSGDMFLVNGDALRAWMADPVNLANRTRNATAGGLQEFIANGRSWAAVKSGDSYQIDEKVTSAYAEAHVSADLLGRPMQLVGGLRFTHTNLTSSGTMRVLQDLVCETGTDVPGPNESCNAGILFPVYSSTDLEAISVKNSYSNLLPSMNFRWDIANDMVLRLAAAKTLTRPQLESLAPAIFYRSLFAVTRTAYGNNPNLRPYTALNLDASWEYYYGRDKGISIAGFYKNMDDYIVSTIAAEQVDSIETPAFREFNVTRPRNAEKAKVKGVTLGWLHTFDFGLGFQANYTKVSGKVSSKSDPTQNFRLPGVSDTANLVGFFERGPLGLRVAWNWRDRFLAASTYGGYQHPRYFRPYQQVDARLSFAAPMGVGLALDVVNLTKATVLSHGINQNAFISYGDYGRRFTLSASKRF